MISPPLSPAVKQVAPSAIYLATKLSKFSRQFGLLKGVDLITLEVKCISSAVQ